MVFKIIAACQVLEPGGPVVGRKEREFAALTISRLETQVYGCRPSSNIRDPRDSSQRTDDVERLVTRELKCCDGSVLPRQRSLSQ